MSLLRKAFLYVGDVGPEFITVSMADMPSPIKIPRALFDDALLAQLKQGTRLSATTNRTRLERRLIVSGPFALSTEGPPVAAASGAVRHEGSAHMRGTGDKRRMLVVDVWVCKRCAESLCAECDPESTHEHFCKKAVS